MRRLNIRTSGITPTQQRTLSCLGEGYTVKEIAGELKISPKTAEFHVANLYNILNMHSPSKLVRAAIAFGLCSPLCLLLLLSTPVEAQAFLTVSNPSPVVQIAWSPPPTGLVGFYKVYYGTGSGQYTTNFTVATGVTNAAITLPTRGVTYFFAITDVTPGGLESQFSNETSYTAPLPNAPPTQKPLTVLTVMKSKRIDGGYADTGMRWSDTPDQTEAYYKLHIERGLTLSTATPPLPPPLSK